MAYKPPTTPTSDPAQKEPVIQGSSDQKPYVGKPKPMPPTPKPPQRPVYGSSDGSGFDFQKYLAGQHRPRPVQVLPGQGQGPMPVGTKPLPNPVVKDPRTGGGSLDDWIKSHPNGPIYDEWPGSWNRGPSGEGPDAPWRRGMTPEMGLDGKIDPRYGGGSATPWLDGKFLPMDIGPGSANQRAQDFLRAEWEAKNGGGMTAINSDARINPDGSVSGRNNQNGWDPWLGGTRAPGRDGIPGQVNVGGGPVNSFMGDDRGGNPENPYARVSQFGDKNFNDTGGRPWGPPTNAGEKPSGGRNNQNVWDPYQPNIDGGDMKPGGMGQGGQLVQPDIGMPARYGGGPKAVSDVNYGAPIQRDPGAPSGPPPVGTGPGSMGKPRQPRPNRPPQGRPPVNPQQMQQGAQALYNDNTIPHEFKGQLMQAAQSGDPQAFNDMLFNSNIPHETKLRLQQMFGYGGQGGAPMQSATPDQGQNPYQEVTNGISQAYNGVKGSPYYGAF